MKDNIVEVKLWGKTVGLLSWDDKRGCSVFQFDKNFSQSGLNIAPLTAPLDSPYVQKTFPMSGNKEKIISEYWIKKIESALRETADQLNDERKASVIS